MKKEKIEDWEKEFDNLWDYNGCSECSGIEVDMDKVKSFIRQLLAQQEKEILEEIEKELPDQYEDKKLGSVDLTLNEMFERGYNSCLIQVRNKLEKLKKEIKKELNKERFIRCVPPIDKHYPMTGKDLTRAIIGGILFAIVFTIVVYLIFFNPQKSIT